MTSADCSLDAGALAALRDERLDWRFKAIPSALWGLTLGEAARQRPRLFGGDSDDSRDGFVGPFVTLDAGALEHNLRTMACWCDVHGIRLAPHGKTTMAPQLFSRQADHGAWAITAANAGQLRVYRAFGVSRVLLANQLVDPAALHWLAGELDGDASFQFSCWVDTVRSVELMTGTLNTAVNTVRRDARRPVDVLVELGGEGGRTGARSEEDAIAVAEAVRDSPALRLVGVGGYEGSLAHDSSERSQRIVATYLRRMRALTTTLAERGFFADADQVVVTAGGSAYFDQVARELVGGWGELSVLPVLRSGAYITHDDGFYRGISPLGEHPRADGPVLRPALRAWAQVTSKPRADLALLTLGKRDASFDEGLPEPQLVRQQGKTAELAGHEITKMNDQHSFLALPAGSPVGVGDWIGLGLSHPCTVFDKWSLLPVVDGETVVDLVRTFF